MADILIVAATHSEARFLSGKIKKSSEGTIVNVSKTVFNSTDVLITGAGMVATTYHLTNLLAQKKYDLAINIGICGSLNPALLPVRVVNVLTDQFGDFGADNGKEFLDAFDLGFLKSNSFPFKSKKLQASYRSTLRSLKALPVAEGITVQNVTGSAATAKRLTTKYGLVTESMEGAAFFYVCLMKKIKCLQIRAISNKVEQRNRKNWKIKEAIDALDGFIGLLLMELEAKGRS